MSSEQHVGTASENLMEALKQNQAAKVERHMINPFFTGNTIQYGSILEPANDKHHTMHIM